MRDFPPGLKDVEFSLVHFLLEFQEPYRLTRETLLRLRRDLHRAAVHCLDGRGGERFAALFDPPLSADPAALRRFQRPAPPFVLLPDPDRCGRLDAGDLFDLPVVFWGRGRQRLADLLRVFQALGVQGLHRGEGPFVLAAVEAEDAAGSRHRLWQEGRESPRLAPTALEAHWWLGSFPPPGGSEVLEFVTPARLLVDGRPLFRVSFRRLFPFLLRRVTSMLHAHCGVEVVDDPRPLLELAGEVEERENRLRWEDWRTLAGLEGSHELGGIVGSVHLAGEALDEILWVLRLGTLLNAGKGAAFGAGRFVLHSA